MRHRVVQTERTGVVPQDNPLAVRPGNCLRVPLPRRDVSEGRTPCHRRLPRQTVQNRDHHGTGQRTVWGKGCCAGAGHQIVRPAILCRFRVPRPCRYVRVHRRGVADAVCRPAGGVVGAGALIVDGALGIEANVPAAYSSIPSLLAAAVVNIVQVIAERESISPNAGHAGGNLYLRQSGATLESCIANAGHTVCNDNFYYICFDVIPWQSGVVSVNRLHRSFAADGQCPTGNIKVRLYICCPMGVKGSILYKYSVFCHLCAVLSGRGIPAVKGVAVPAGGWQTVQRPAGNGDSGKHACLNAIQDKHAALGVKGDGVLGCSIVAVATVDSCAEQRSVVVADKRDKG